MGWIAGAAGFGVAGSALSAPSGMLAAAGLFLGGMPLI